MSEFRYALIVQYDGAAFAGFQLQQNIPTVQGELEKALATALREKVILHVSGRTDTGVHASGQVVSFACSREYIDEYRLLSSLNALMPDSVSAMGLTPVPSDFNARFSCVAREYEYLIYNGPMRSTHWKDRALWLRNPMDLTFLNAELQTILGQRDFGAFTRAAYRDETTIRYIDRASIEYIPDPLTGSDDLVSFKIRGNAFLHNMIRIIVGTLVDLTRGRLEGSLLDIVESKDRLRAGQTAPSMGLYFRRAYYHPVPAFDGKEVRHLRISPDYPLFGKRGEANRQKAT